MGKNNTTKAFDYCMYKMFANCFYSARSKNLLYVKRMQLDFAEMDAKQKIEYEIRCYQLVKLLKTVLPESFFKNNVEIHIHPTKHEDVEFMVRSNGYVLSFSTKNQKNKASLQYRLAKE